MVTDLQVRRLFAMKNKVKYLYQLADKAGMSAKTARKYLKSGSLPSQCKAVHDWATHPDAFAQDWPWVEDFMMLSEEENKCFNGPNDRHICTC